MKDMGNMMNHSEDVRTRAANPNNMGKGNMGSMRKAHGKDDNPNMKDFGMSMGMGMLRHRTASPKNMGKGNMGSMKKAHMKAKGKNMLRKKHKLARRRVVGMGMMRNRFGMGKGGGGGDMHAGGGMHAQGKGMDKGKHKGKDSSRHGGGGMHAGGDMHAKGRGHRDLVEKEKWVLIKKSNGECKCVQRAQGRTVLGKYDSLRECEDHRTHDC